MKLSELPQRQQQVVKLVSRGLSDKEIANILEVELQTAKNFLQLIYRSAGIESGNGDRIGLIRQFYDLVEKKN